MYRLGGAIHLCRALPRNLAAVELSAPRRGSQLGDSLASGRAGQIFNHQRRRLIGVIVPNADDAKRPPTQRDRVAALPHHTGSASDGRRVGGLAILVLEPVDDAISVSWT